MTANEMTQLVGVLKKSHGLNIPQRVETFDELLAVLEALGNPDPDAPTEPGGVPPLLMSTTGGNGAPRRNPTRLERVGLWLAGRGPHPDGNSRR